MFDSLFGGGQYALKMLFAFIAVFGLLALALWLVRRFTGERLPGGAARGRQPRLAVIDAATVDSRRRLVLVRRDNVEHLMMIGGPTDVVVESNIVRAAAVPRETAAPRPTSAADALPRPVPGVEGTTWPLQPEGTFRNGERAGEKIEPPARPESPPLLRAQRPALPLENGSQWSGPEPDVVPSPQPLRDRRSRHDPLAGLAEELGRVPSPAEPRVDAAPRPAPRREPRPPRQQTASLPPTPAIPVPEPRLPSPADQNLAEMAQRLEAALRRPGKGEETRPQAASLAAESTEEAREAPGAADASPTRLVAPAESAAPARNEARPARADGKPPPGKSLYDSLEQEMASLLGRPAGKN